MLARSRIPLRHFASSAPDPFARAQPTRGVPKSRELALVLRENLHKAPSEVNATVFAVGDLQAEAGEVNRQLVARAEQQPVAEDPLVVAINLRLKDH